VGLTPEERAAVNEAAPDENSFSAYVVMRGRDYLRFASYSKATGTRNPLAATLYSRLTDAKRRVRDGAYINRVEVKEEFKVVFITFTLNGFKVVTW
jgi:oligoendopeptidase F